MHTSEKSTPTIEPSIAKLPMEMAFIFVNLLLKMNYVFSTLIFKKSISKLWTFQHPNSSKIQLDFMLKKRRNNCVNSEVWNRFAYVNYDHQIICKTICLSLSANKKTVKQNSTLLLESPSKCSHSKRFETPTLSKLQIDFKFFKKKTNQISLPVLPRMVLSLHIMGI